MIIFVAKGEFVIIGKKKYKAKLQKPPVIDD